MNQSNNQSRDTIIETILAIGEDALSYKLAPAKKLLGKLSDRDMIEYLTARRPATSLTDANQREFPFVSGLKH